MWVHRRLAALALFGVQLLQGTLTAAGGACADPASAIGGNVTTAVPAAVSAAPTGSVPATTAHHGHHAMASTPTTVAAPAPADIPTESPAQSGAPAHPHESTTCAMAMACAVAGLMSTAVTVELHDVLVATDRSVHVTDWPVSLDIAPEPPPPKG